VSWPAAERHLLDEIRRVNGRDAVLELDVTESDLRLDGRLRANAQPALAAVRVAFDAPKLGGPMLYQCDEFDWWQDNVRGIGLTLEALRRIADYGAASRAEQYAGWRQISAAPARFDPDNLGPDDAWSVLVSMAELPVTEAMNASRHSTQGRLVVLKRARRRAHPDMNNGNHERWDLFMKAENALHAATHTEASKP
jgi:hypothetical protein